MLTIKAPAKVNWFLEVKGKRPDGFHELETVMQAVSLFDEITVEDRPDGVLSLECNIDLGDPTTNLVYRAAGIMRQAHAPGRGAHIALKKQIPHGAGLGGGSSDAANALIALNRLWQLNLHKNVLEELVSKVGSDCAFFISGGTAICTGRGEIVQSLPDMVGLHLVILYPNDVCPTGQVYSLLARDLTYSPRNCYLFHHLPENLDPKQLASGVFNRLQDYAIQVSRKLADAWKATAQEPGVLVRFVSGSGSSVAFLMQSESAAKQLEDSLTARSLGRTFAVQTLPGGAVWG
ncbi:MAG: 4-(cytidine 5'-diphospho)-2-C-methyl-D-erythritol kinase [Planctomycetes bacterium]|nr:4-(cytidine 5'-diphospho)-2-C-methyl-D-erythritol kinase [Planctomycetota bacterium]